MQCTSPDCSKVLPTDVLIVEDDPINALDYEDMMLAFGVTKVRTAATVAAALDMIAQRRPDLALLDVGLMREKSFAIADELAALKIPFAFVTGYAAEVTLPSTFADRPRLAKPFTAAALRAMLRRLGGGG